MRAPIAGWLAAALLLAAPAAGQQGEETTSAADEPPGRAIFLRACATCHGPDGGGAGSVPLDRPARSFRDGGFSFGNTAEALQRTISVGIPGTPMPGFGSAFGEGDLRAVAAYVRSLGPAEEPVDARDAVLVVTDQPLVVRGILPPIAPELPLRPRGLLIGTLDGLTFEYRVDDVRLLGVRAGGFVERTDWTGRGGTPLCPLGQVVHLEAGGDPPPRFAALRADAGAGAAAGDIPLTCRFTGTWIETPAAGLDYELRLPGGRAVARVRESGGAVHTLAGSGFLRHFVVIWKRGDMPTISLQVDDVAPDARVERFTAPARAEAANPLRPDGPTRLWVARRADGGFLCTGVRDFTAAQPSASTEVVEGEHGLLVRLRPPPRGETQTVVLRVITLLASQWTEDLRATLLKELPP